MTLKCAISKSATILRKNGKRTLNHSTESKSQPCHARGNSQTRPGNSGTTTNYCADTSQSFAKYHMDVKTGETKLLGVPWNKALDTIVVSFPTPIVKVTKREILRKIAEINDPLELASPVKSAGKML